MGAQQSSAGGQPEGSAAAQKTCYYELLGVDRLASDDDIRKAYKKKALELHPDRNIHDVENATKKFAEVQTAYEVLSDVQERAWYDSHRDAILRGETDPSDAVPSEHYNVRLTTTEDIYALMGCFNSTVPFTDGPYGFFGMLDTTFGQLAEEEAVACEWDGLALTAYPPFGSSSDDYGTVAKPFYSAWSAFSTRKSFSWRDRYRLSDAPDRRVRRLMEKENKKLRDDAIRDFNDAVRSLVAFVKKRDPRYVPSTQSEAERQKTLRDSAAAQAARSRAANQERLAGSVVPEWARSREDDVVENDEFVTSSDESEIEQIECVVCNKSFKTEKQFEAHERSKKHTKATQQLRRQMKRENADHDLHEDAVLSPSSPNVQLHDNTPYSVDEADAEDQQLLEHMADLPTSPPLDGAQQMLRLPTRGSGDNDDSHSDGHNDEDDEGKDDDYAPRDAVEQRIADRPPSSPSTADQDREGGEGLARGVADLTLGEPAVPKKPGKARAKREKRAARQAEADTSHTCGVCLEAFDSRTKLFSHIRALDHAQLRQSASQSRKRDKKPKG